ncbi:HAMP domain-containing sensor histidine kinase [Notoacmeibacter sp. MSK16QG-6]|uniref:sensor histidine kinase n=1 Tax=Notoacmeibacter sp. MSK16QG-6 TaxID=2957982 RepID=UPI00209EEBF1|nr:HAMP domain-containing sensor histidine kinase [Notoacmeibacter sp. MSK16QG-6]MCP1198148.1 HAMP domain-containing histidine kinase [Notoacmeibacter sp. MSK16QG-6]
MVLSVENASDDWRSRIAAAFDRFVNRDVTEPVRRQRQARLFGSILSVTILLIVLSMPLSASDPSYLAFPFLAGAAGCVLSAMLSASGRETLCAILTGVFALGFAALTLVKDGNATGIAFLIMAVPVVEGWWALRRPLLTGFATTLAAGTAIGVLLTGWSATSPTLWNVAASVALVLWIGSLLLRMKQPARDDMETAADDNALLTHPLANDLPGAIAIFAPDGDLLAASDRLESLLGVEVAHLLGSSFFERIHVGDRVGWLNAVADAREGKEAQAIMRMRLAYEGEVAFADLSARLSSERDGRLVGMLAIDSEAAARQCELDKLREEAGALASARNHFLATVSHEMRTPLNAIIGFADMICSDAMPDHSLERHREYAELISASGGHLLKVVNAILDLSKMEAGAYTIQRELFDPAEALDMPLSIAAQQGEIENVSVSRLDCENLRPVNADRRSVQQILINLLSNAVKFTPAGGKVEVAMRDDGRNFSIAVRDTGVGIAEDDLPRLGKPFIQLGDNGLARQHDGAGLGLSLVHGLAELQGGHVRIESRLGEGTEVIVTIPNLGASEAINMPTQTGANESLIEPNRDIQQRRTA